MADFEWDGWKESGQGGSGRARHGNPPSETQIWVFPKVLPRNPFQGVCRVLEDDEEVACAKALVC